MEDPNKGTLPGMGAAAAGAQKTTPDEGKTFDKDTQFVCVTDCWQDNVLYRRGYVITGRKCPPHFAVQQKEEKQK